MEVVKKDLTVIGAGLAGMCAAVSAARNGLKVALINDRPVLGGNASSEIGVSINGAAHAGHSSSVYARETGIMEEIKLYLYEYDKGEFKRQATFDAAMFDIIYGESNISLYLNTLAYDTEVEQSRIKSICAMQIGSERSFKFESPLYIDASGDGAIGAKTGALYMWGREAKDQFGESLAPEKADNYTQGHSLILNSRDMGRRVVYKRPKFAYDITKMDFFKDLGTKHRIIRRHGNEYHGFWWVEFGGQLNTIFDKEDITLELRKLNYGIWDYIKNSGEFDDVDNLALDFISAVVGKRESRRFIGEYVLSQKDIINKKNFDDSVAIGGWPMDVHAPKGIYDSGFATYWHFVPGIYNIPFRCLYSKNITNLMFAGRNASCTSIAFGSTRVSATGGAMGQAVGTAAVLCKKHEILPSQIVPKHQEELQDMLQRDDQTIMGRSEKVNEELLKELKITVSSTKNYSNEPDNNVYNSIKELEHDICLALPLIAEVVESVEIKVKNLTAERQKLEIKILGGKMPENYLPDHKIKELIVDVPASLNGWIKIPLHCEKSHDGKVYIVFKVNRALGVYVTEEPLTGVVTFKHYVKKPDFSDYREICLSRLNENICFRNVTPNQEIYGASNLVNGYSRPYGLPNIWISEKLELGRPEYIEFKYDSPKSIRELHIIFNSMLEEDNFNHTIYPLVKDYDIEITTDNGEKKTININGNYLRANRHNLKMQGVINIKIIIKSNYGSRYAEVYSIKLF